MFDAADIQGRDFAASPAVEIAVPPVRTGRVIPLAMARKGDVGVVVGVGVHAHAADVHGPLEHGVANTELERRLLEIGFVEGARLSVLHEGLFGRDPLAVRVDDTRIALRRREAADILFQLDAPPARTRA